MRSESTQQLDGAKPKSNMLTWLLAGGCGCFALLSCITCGGVGTWWYLQKQSANAMEGVWEFSRGPIPPNMRGVKLVVGNQLIATLYDRNTKRMVLLNGATFTRDGSTYKEDIDFTSPGIQQVLLGKQQSFTMKITGDTINLNGTLSNGNRIDEDWRRIATPTGEPQEGAWELVRSTLNPNWRAVKLITGGQSVLVVYDRKLKTVLAIRGGPCTVKDKTMFETPEYSDGNPEDARGEQTRADMRFEGDEMTLTRVIQPGGNVNTEIWKRIK